MAEIIKAIVWKHYCSGEVYPWFDGVVIAWFLGYKNPKDAVKRLVRDEEKRIQHGRVFISEWGLWKFIFRSRRDVAKELQPWITDEIIPFVSLHRTFAQR